MDVNPIELHKYLEGVDHPASKDDLVRAAQSNGAPSEMLRRAVVAYATIAS